MSERTKKFSDELEKLISEGDALSMAMEYECMPEKWREAYLKAQFTKRMHGL